MKFELPKLGSKKGQMGLGGLSGAFLAIVVAILVAAFGALILSTIGATMTPNSAEANMTTTGVTVLSSMIDLIQPLGIVIVAGVILGVLFMAFRGFGASR
jgi:hypothetical protein